MRRSEPPSVGSSTAACPKPATVEILTTPIWTTFKTFVRTY
nr:MAG TPA: hypothetical protein [Bacteriophage sp.]